MDLLDKTAILLTAHPRQQKWWRSVLLSLENYPGPLVFSYDDIDTKPIPTDIMMCFDSYIVTGEPAGSLGHARGELICIRNGLAAVVGLDMDYVLKIGFDEPIWRWRNIRDMIAEMTANKLDCIDNDTRLILGRPKQLFEGFNLFNLETLPAKPAEAHWRSIVKALALKHKRVYDYDYWRKLLGVTHLQGEYGANIGKGNTYAWSVGELWPRPKDE